MVPGLSSPWLGSALDWILLSSPLLLLQVLLSYLLPVLVRNSELWRTAGAQCSAGGMDVCTKRVWWCVPSSKWRTRNLWMAVRGHGSWGPRLPGNPQQVTGSSLTCLKRICRVPSWKTTISGRKIMSITHTHTHANTCSHLSVHTLKPPPLFWT